jgi:tRNA(Ile2) C34 agmatinyltransferase TiaS
MSAYGPVQGPACEDCGAPMRWLWVAPGTGDWCCEPCRATLAAESERRKAEHAASPHLFVWGRPLARGRT